MKTTPLRCLIAATLIPLPGLAASPDFGKTFAEALGRVAAEAGDDEPGKPLVMPQVMAELRKHGTNSEIGAEVVRVLRGEVNQDWAAALNISGLLGPSFDQTAITSAVRDSLPRVMTLGTRWPTILSAVSHLCAYGTPNDIEVLKKYAAQVRLKDKLLADGFDATLVLGQSSRRLIESHRPAADSQSSTVKAQVSGSVQGVPSIIDPPKSPVKPSEIESTAQPQDGISWSLIVVLIVAAIGLLWLMLKGRK